MQVIDADLGTTLAPVFDYRAVAEARGVPDNVLSTIEEDPVSTSGQVICPVLSRVLPNSSVSPMSVRRTIL